MDISFSGAEVAVIISLLVSVTTPLALLYRRTLEVQTQLMQEKDRQILRLEQQNDRLVEASASGTRAVESATTALSKTRVQR